MYFFLVCLLILLLVVISYFFSGAETSIISVNSARMHELENKGDIRARKVNILSKSKDKVLGVILLCNTLVNITSSALATALAVEYFHSDGIGIALSSTAMTIIILLFAEVLPKTYAIYNPTKIALFSAPILRVVWIILYPITNFIQITVNYIMKILSLNTDRETISAAEAIRDLISLHRHDNTMLKQDIDILNSVLDLAETEISEIMTHRKEITAVDMSLDNNSIMQQVLDSKYTNIPLWKNSIDNIEGVINVHDLIVALRKESSYNKINLEEIIQKPIFTPDTTPLSTQLYNFRVNENNFAVVVDEYGSLQGIVTLSDILEEIVGDIHYDDKNDVVKLSENRYSIAGKVSVRDINRKMQWDLPEDDASTLAGIIIHAVERIPEKGEIFELFNLNFKILQKEEKFITRIEVIEKRGN